MKWLCLALAALVAEPSLAVPSGLSRRVDDSMIQPILDAHNFYRSEHGANDLVWNGYLAQASQDWANECDFDHDSIGENLANRWPWTNWADFINMWGQERLKYDFVTNAWDPSIGHFTQMVWKETTSVGCAWQGCIGLGVYLVCKYDPPGNWLGEFAWNVGSLTKGSLTDVYVPPS